MAAAQRFVLAKEPGGTDYSFEMRKENEPGREYATLVVSAHSFPQALRAALAWAASYSERKMRDGQRVFPRVKYAGSWYTATKISEVRDPRTDGYVFLDDLGYRPLAVVPS